MEENSSVASFFQHTMKFMAPYLSGMWYKEVYDFSLQKLSSDNRSEHIFSLWINGVTTLINASFPR